jgi:cytochrome c peroxidase
MSRKLQGRGIGRRLRHAARWLPSLALAALVGIVIPCWLVVSAEGEPVSERPEPRPVLSEAEYEKLANRLRKIYSQPQAKWPEPTVDESVDAEPLGLMPEMTYPEENPYSEAKSELGKMLFFDPRLSSSRQIACASCHDPDLAWADGRMKPFGHRRHRLDRNTPSLLNVGYNEHFFWDGRADTLEEQVRVPINRDDEMHSGMGQVVDRLRQSETYRAKFQAAFGSEKASSEDQPISAKRVVKAIATYERTITTSGRSDFDQFLKGESNAMSDAAIRGLHVFRTKAQCMNCHHGPALTDRKFHDLGLSYYGRKHEDLGRYYVTEDPDDVGKFKTPTLRNVTRTGPYMHMGFFRLEGVMNMYNAGMATLRPDPDQEDDPLFPSKSKLLEPLGLNEHDKADLIAFLKSLEKPVRRVRPPELPPFADEQSGAENTTETGAPADGSEY